MNDIANIKRYCKPVTRKHLTERKIKAFEHPNYASVIILIKADKEILGMVNKNILKDNAKTMNLLDLNVGYIIPFEY